MKLNRALFSLFLIPAALAESYLVAPFANRSKDSNLDWIGESVSESVREALGSAGVSAASREDREDAAKRLSLRPSSQLSLASVFKLAEATESGRAVYGQFEVGGDPADKTKRSLRVVARVLERKTMRQAAELSASGALEDLAAVQGEIAWQVLRWIQPRSSLSREQFLAKHPPVKVPARESYIRGLMAQKPEQRHRLFTQAARLDPSFSDPAFYLGRMHYEQEHYREAAQWLEKVTAENANFQEANFLLGLSRYELSDFESARRVFERLSAALPTGEVWNNLAASQARLNNPQSLDNFRKALQADPTDPDYHFNVGYALWKRGDYDAAAERFRAVLDRTQEDEDTVMLLGRCLKKSGPRTGDWRSEGLERLKDSYEEPVRR